MSKAVETVEAGIVVTTRDFDASFAFYTGLGLRVEQIFPADAPRRATLVASGLRIHLEVGAPRSATIRIGSSETNPANLVSPEGTAIEFAPVHSSIDRPELLSS
ncbi:MAG: VOC family protein, partial [Actinomycetota bacterium]